MSATCICCNETKIYAKKMCNRCYVKDLRQRNKEKNKYRDMTISRLKEQIKELERIILCQKSELKKFQTYRREALAQIWV
tara:strand:- start:2875 stop:3114 length:240 start_codon:yes stop_codon:yes gene_type:complete